MYRLTQLSSAKGSLVDGRDPDTQAFLAFRGVTANGFKRNEATILDNKEWYDYVKLLKTNFGPKFDLSKLYYDKIIIETDSDIDGLTNHSSFKTSLTAGKSQVDNQQRSL